MENREKKTVVTYGTYRGQKLTKFVTEHKEEGKMQRSIRMCIMYEEQQNYVCKQTKPPAV